MEETCGQRRCLHFPGVYSPLPGCSMNRSCPWSSSYHLHQRLDDAVHASCRCDIFLLVGLQHLRTSYTSVRPGFPDPSFPDGRVRGMRGENKEATCCRTGRRSWADALVALEARVRAMQSNATAGLPEILTKRCVRLLACYSPLDQLRWPLVARMMHNGLHKYMLHQPAPNRRGRDVLLKRGGKGNAYMNPSYQELSGSRVHSCMVESTL